MPAPGGQLLRDGCAQRYSAVFWREGVAGCPQTGRPYSGLVERVVLVVLGGAQGIRPKAATDALDQLSGAMTMS